ncbi:MAG: FemAB family PEP-CTERM system-associated protein [Nitrososphaera sp.]|nr:FemAB family PEP-CTERM system-associated protein [Nitrososphaera sp.]
MRSYKFKRAEVADRELWNGYVRKHPNASLFHMFGWRDVIHNTYGHATYYVMACEGEDDSGQENSVRPGKSTVNILGVLPLVHLKHAVFGNYLISLPFLDGGGVLADCRTAEQGLLFEAIRLGREIGAARIELRHEQPPLCWDEIGALYMENSGEPLKTAASTHKVRMLLSLPDSVQTLIKTFDSKLRNQINKPLKEGLSSRTGGIELLEDFYRIFLANMRDLGSPVHSIKLMHQVLREFPEQSKIIVVYRANEPMASALVVGFNRILANPWASSLRKYALLSPNMLLYFRMLEYACDNRYQTFDFGRSSPGEGTYQFKEQWGAVPAPLYWHCFSVNGKPLDLERSDKARFQKAIRYWKMLPLPVTRIIGPCIRKHIGL